MKTYVSLMVFALFLFSMFMLSSTCASAYGVKIQLCLIIDGSGSIPGSDWTIITEGIATAIRNNLPHDGSVELTLVQFGYSFPEYARTEVPPTVITYTNFETVANTVENLIQSGGGTPMAHGLFLGWDEIKSSPNFPIATKQIINVATDGGANERNYDATTDLDGNGSVDAFDDVISVVDNAKIEGLDELDMEGIAITDTLRDWYKDWALVPQPGISAPPFSKPGWIRVVADASEFANTIGQKLEVIITEETIVWVPSIEGALAAGFVTVGVISMVSSLASAVSNLGNYPSNNLAYKINNALPGIFKKWLYEFISSKQKFIVMQKVGSPFTLTRQEIFSFALSLSVLTFVFSYAKAGNFNQILPLIPIVFSISILIEFLRNFVVEAVAKSQGVWSEYHLWYFGLSAILFTALTFQAPFSWPARMCHHSPRFTIRSLGLVSLVGITVLLASATIFYLLFISGLALIGSMGLVMSLTMAFFNSIPIPPLDGKDIYNWSKVLWTGLFMTAFSLYILSLLLL